MRKMRRFICGLTLIAFLTAGVSGCIDVEDNEIKYVIGVSCSDMTRRWQLRFKEEMDSATSRFPEVRIFFTDAATEVNRQVSDVEKLLNFGADAIVVIPTDYHELKNELDKAYASIPVIILDRNFWGEDYSLSISVNNEGIGELAGKLALSLMKGKGKIMELCEAADDQINDKISSGFSAFMKPAEIKRLDLKSASREAIEDAVQTYCGENGFNLIFAHNDEMARAAAQAARSLSRGKISVIGVDGFPGANGGRESVQNGEIDGTVLRPTGASEALNAAIDLIRRRNLPARMVLSGSIYTVSKQPPAAAGEDA